MSYRSIPRNPGKRLGKGAGRRPRPAAPDPTALATTPAPQRERGRLFVEPEQVRQGADGLSALMPRVGGRLSDLSAGAQGSEEERVVLEVDPLVGHVGAVVGGDLLRYDEVVAASGVDPAGHGELRAQVEALTTAYEGATARDRDIDDSLRAVGHDTRGMRAALRGVIPVALETGAIAGPKRQQLRSLWLSIEAEEARLKERELSAREAGARDGAAAQASLGKAERRDDLVAAMIDLQQGRALDPARGAATIRSYDELREEAAATTPEGTTPTRRARRR